LEDVGIVLIKYLIGEIMFENKLSLNEINDKIQSFNYGQQFAKTKPSVVTMESFNLSASQTWCFLVHFAFIFGIL
jgi:hypothetical protein